MESTKAPPLAGIVREGELPPGLITPVQETLLRIIYSPDAIAKPLFEEWQAAVDMQDLDQGCYRLYPYLYRRVRDVAPDHRFLGLLKGNFRRSLYRNHLLFQWAREVIDRLAAEGIETIVLKGAALVRSLGLSAGFRPMSDVDLLVRTRDARRAMEIAGPRFRAVVADPIAADAHILLRHGVTVSDDRRLELDLHWRVSGAWAAGEDPDAPFWDHAETIDLHGAPTRVLAPTELLFHVVVHGLAWNFIPPIRWISDTLDILALDRERIDWPRLVALARRYQRRMTLRVAFAYLERVFGATVPAPVMAALREPVTAAEIATLRMRVRVHGLPVEAREAGAVMSERLARVEERLPGRRRIVYLTERIATPDMLALVRALDADVVIEAAPGGDIQVEARRQIVASAEWARRFDGAATLLQFDLDTDAGPFGRLPIYARMRPSADGKWILRVFATSLRDWPVGAVVFRMDAVIGFATPSLLGADDAVPNPFLPIGAGFPEVAIVPTPAAAAAPPAAIEAEAAPAAQER